MDFTDAEILKLRILAANAYFDLLTAGNKHEAAQYYELYLKLGGENG